MSKQQQHHNSSFNTSTSDTNYQRQQKYINSSSTSTATQSVQANDHLGSSSSTSSSSNQVKNATQISGIAIITTNNNKENNNFIKTTMKPNHTDMDLDSLFDGTYGGASDDLSLNYNLLINNLEPIEMTDEQITATTKLNGQRYNNHHNNNNNNNSSNNNNNNNTNNNNNNHNNHHNHHKMTTSDVINSRNNDNNNENLSHNNDYNNNNDMINRLHHDDTNDTNNNTKINNNHYRSGKHRSYNKRPSVGTTGNTTTTKRFKTTLKTSMDSSTTTTTQSSSLNQKFNHKSTTNNHDTTTAMRYNIEEKLRELFIELIADRATCSYLKEFNLKRTSFLLDKLVLRDKLNTLIITLYPGNKGYSLAFRKNNLHDHHYGGTMPVNNATLIGRKPLLNDSTNSPSIEILHETMVWPYEDADLLDCLDNEEIPQALMEFLHTKCLHLFYSGCVVAEIRDYRQSFPVVDICDNYHVLLRPSYQNILAAVHQHTDCTWSSKDKLTLESQLVLATAEPMCLDPDPRVGIHSINEQSRRIVFNGTAIKRQMAKYSQCAMNRKRKVDSKTQNYGLELPDFLLRAKKVQALKRSAVAALRPPEVQGKPEMGQKPASEVNALRYGRRYPRLSDSYNDDKKNEKYRKIDDWAPQLIEEFTLETERDNGIYHVKVSLFQRASNSEYSGELYVDRHYKPNEVNGKTCRFVLGSQVHANRYIQEFKEIFTEEGRKSVKITHEIPGQKPIITCTGTLLHQQIQARHAAQAAAAAAAAAAAQVKRQITMIPVTPATLPRALIASPIAIQNGIPESPKTVVINALPTVTPVRDSFVVPPPVTPVRDTFVVPPTVTPIRDNFVATPVVTPVRDNFVVPPPVTPVRDNFVVQTVLPEFTIKATPITPTQTPAILTQQDNKPATETKLLIMQPTQIGDTVTRANLHQQLQQRQQRQFQQIQPQLSPQLQQQLQANNNNNNNENNSTIRQILRQPPAPMNQSTYHQPTTMYVNSNTTEIGQPMTLYTFTDLQQNVQLLAGNALVSTSPLVLTSNNQLDFTTTSSSGTLTVDPNQHQQQQLPGNRHRQV